MTNTPGASCKAGLGSLPWWRSVVMCGLCWSCPVSLGERGWVVSGFGAWDGVWQVTLVQNLILLPPFLGEGQEDATQSDMKPCT